MAWVIRSMLGVTPPNRKLGAKLDSIGASAFSRACCLDGRYTQLKERNFHGKDTCFPVT